MASVETIFMSIETVHGPPGKSFEEVRIEDYLKAYSTTGRPPLPCPQDPADANQRVLMSLPPLFKPYSERSLLGGPSSQPLLPSPIQTRPANPAELPDAQAFFTSTVEGEIYHSISAMPRYNAFSPEELRFYAYMKGHKFPPSNVPPAPFVIAPPSSSLGSSMGNRPLLSAPTLLTGAGAGTGETVLHICAQAEYAGHSPEELRIACLRAGRELTSQEIVGSPGAGVTPVAPPVLFSGIAGSPFARPAPVRLF
ncbi:hypothetical protein BDZ94DRAFT_1254819 [Collybia nuda]|uniref:Uncharacterized protein n=1 Tax=Collybia nuda TaxID=64659 RepID=A0A9P6CLS9_9AGAR|nr:hypothetical protein BDZ94DRAFT_1254819 [Collybia nuda]